MGLFSQPLLAIRFLKYLLPPATVNPGGLVGGNGDNKQGSGLNRLGCQWQTFCLSGSGMLLILRRRNRGGQHQAWLIWRLRGPGSFFSAIWSILVKQASGNLGTSPLSKGQEKLPFLMTL